MDMDRRTLLAGSFSGGAALAVAPTALGQTAASVSTPPVTKNGKSALSPDEALALLQAGNAAFLRDETRQPDLTSARRLLLAKGQSPFCAYVSCSDSRVPPELLFGRGLGELFIIRNAGNTVDTVAMGSIEYAVAVLGVPLVVVMGHEACGAVKAAMSVVDKNAEFPGAIGKMIEPIIPAVLAARGHQGDPTENAAKQNVRRVVAHLRTAADPILLKPQAEGKVKIIGAYYRLSSGEVEFFDRGEPAA